MADVQPNPVDDNFDSSDAEMAKEDQGNEDENNDMDSSMQVEAPQSGKQRQRTRRNRIVSSDNEDENDEDEDDAAADESSSEESSSDDDDSSFGGNQKLKKSKASLKRRAKEEGRDGETPVKSKREPRKRQPAKAKGEKKAPVQKPQKPETEIDRALNKLKPTKKKELTAEEKQQMVESTLNIMKYAFLLDRERRKKGKPEIEKLKKLDEVLESLNNHQLLQMFVDHGVGHVLVDWLRPGRTYLPNEKIRSKLFQAIERMPFPHHEERIKESQIGKMLNFYRSHPEETVENKRLTNAIISSWMDIMKKNTE